MSKLPARLGATAGLALARTDWRSHFGRRHPQPAGPQRPSHRDARGFYARRDGASKTDNPRQTFGSGIVNTAGQGGSYRCPLKLRYGGQGAKADFECGRICFQIARRWLPKTQPCPARTEVCGAEGAALRLTLRVTPASPAASSPVVTAADTPNATRPRIAAA